MMYRYVYCPYWLVNSMLFKNQRHSRDGIQVFIQSILALYSIDIFCHLLNVKFWKCYKTFLSNFKGELQMNPRGTHWCYQERE